MNPSYYVPPEVEYSPGELVRLLLDILVNLPPVRRNDDANDSMYYEPQEVPTIYAYHSTNKAVARGKSSRIGTPEK